MDERLIHITEFDRKRLREMMIEHMRTKREDKVYIDNLEAELARARIVEPRDVPPNVVTMNSKVVIEELESGDELIFRLVFPEEADITQSKVSVLAPLGTAVLGYRVGDVFAWKVPDGERQYRVKAILYQPEAAGDYHL